VKCASLSPVYEHRMTKLAQACPYLWPTADTSHTKCQSWSVKWRCNLVSRHVTDIWLIYHGYFMITPDRIEVKDRSEGRGSASNTWRSSFKCDNGSKPVPDFARNYSWTLLLSLSRFCERRSAPVIVPYNHLGFKHYAFIEWNDVVQVGR